ncbi:MAG: lysoplasmalogenase [Myxococcales bacterium]|nr:lysoplasmalogenase [Myxococcales bacterium]
MLPSLPLSPLHVPPLTILAGAIALAYVGVVAAGIRGRVRAIKPLPALLLAVAYPRLAPVLACWAAGDALLLDKDRFFLHGLGAFLLGHVAYVGIVGPVTGVSVPWLGVGVVLAVGLLALLWPGLRPRLRAPVTLYAFAIAGMLAVAGPAGALPGAALFLISDTCLAWNRFRRPLPRGDLLVMTTYYGSMFLLAMGTRIEA